MPNVDSDSAAACSSTTPVPRIALEGAFNLRDLGGHRSRDGRHVAPGRLYRSDALWQLSDAAVEQLSALGLRTVCDFRAPHECERRRNRLPAVAAPRTVILGFTPLGTQEAWDRVNQRSISPQGVADYMCDHYRALATVHTEFFAGLFATLLEAESLPLLFHCASGKDRTGFAAAIVLTALDVPREHILADYVISDRAEHRRNLDHLFGPQVDPGCREAVAAASPRYLKAAFDALEAQWGDSDRYLREAMRLSEADRRRLQSLLLV